MGFTTACEASNDWQSEMDVEATRAALIAAVEAKKAEVTLLHSNPNLAQGDMAPALSMAAAVLQPLNLDPGP